VHKVLVVPEQRQTSSLGASFFDRESIRVRAARDAAEMLRICRVWRPALLIFDVAALDAGIAELCDELRADAELAGIKILVLRDDDTGAGAAADAEAGADRSVAAEQLQVAVLELLGLRRRRAERVDAQLLARFDGLTGSSAGQPLNFASVVKLSETGAVLETAQELKVGSEGSVLFALPGAADRLTLSCVVRGLVDAEALRFAIEFLDRPEEARVAIAEFVASRRSTSG